MIPAPFFLSISALSIRKGYPVLLQIDDQFRLHSGYGEYILAALPTAVFYGLTVLLKKHTTAASLVLHAEIRILGNMHDAARFQLVDVE